MELSSFLSILASGVLLLALPIVIAVLFQWLRQKNAEFRSHLTVQQQQFIDAGVGVAVRAAEQMGLSQQLAGGGQGKKAFALKTAQDYLNRLGVQIDVNELATLVEAEVRKQFSNAAPVVDNAAMRSALLDKAVETAVLAADQSGLTAVIQNVGSQKKRYALDMAGRYLAEHGLKVDPMVLDGLIEAQIRRLRASGVVLPVPQPAAPGK
jgi:hypothetical protein